MHLRLRGLRRGCWAMWNLRLQPMAVVLMTMALRGLSWPTLQLRLGRGRTGLRLGCVAVVLMTARLPALRCRRLALRRLRLGRGGAGLGLRLALIMRPTRGRVSVTLALTLRRGAGPRRGLSLRPLMTALDIRSLGLSLRSGLPWLMRRLAMRALVLRLGALVQRGLLL